MWANGEADGEDDATVFYVEEWETDADMHRRVASDRFTSLLAIMEAARESPQIHFDFVRVTRGFDYVQEVRQEGTPS